MALRVWLPLNGNLENKGVGNVTISGTGTFVNDGRLGKGYTGGPISMSQNFLTTVGTICFWIKVKTDAAASVSPNQIFSSSGTYGRKWDLFLFSTNTATYPHKNSFHSWGCVKDTSTGSANGSFTYNGLFPNDVWVHVAVAHDTTKQYIYVNGSPYATVAWDSNGTFTFDGICYFANTNSSSIIYNDLRIYDECLSQRQIKEISKGLVAHYKLEASNINTNLAVFNPLVNSGSTSISFDRSTNTYTLVAPVGDSTWGYGVNIGATNKCIVPYNSYYRFSFEVYVPTEHVLVVDYNNYSNNSSVASWNGNDNDLASARLANTKTIPANTWTKCVFGSQNAHANNTSHIDIYEQSKIGLRTASDTGPVTWYLRNFKFELDNKATNYVPYGYDPMEFLTTDVSGNGYHIKLAGNLLCNNDSIRYSTSTIFDNVNTNYLYRDTFNWLNSPYTFNCWVYQTSATTTSSGNTGTTLQFIESQGRDCGYAGFSLCSANGYARLYIGTATTGTYYTINDSTINLLNNWHMLTGTYDGTTAKLYVDGVLKGTKETSIEPVWTEANGFTIGKMAYGHTNTAAYFPFVGSISDARVYATALTADDILTLYKTSGIIDNKGNIYAYEFKEE